jgi:putative membrane protein
MSNSNLPPPPPPPQAMSPDRLSTIKTYILIAFIFNIIALIGWIGAAIVFLFTIILAIPFLVLFVVAILVFLRVYKMYNAVNAGDIATLKTNSDMLWAIIALIFAGVIPGIMLIIADGPIKQL